MSRTPMTASGAQRLREELQQLKSVERPRIITATSIPRSFTPMRKL